MSVYSIKPERLLTHVVSVTVPLAPDGSAYCAGFELKKWRLRALANHLIEWLPEYALPEDELVFNHGNAYAKLKEAAVRVYTSQKYEKRGEAGEIALHAICRDFFDTIPISPRVFYKSASNDVVKSFDLVHAKFLPNGDPQIWLGESKLYSDTSSAVASAIDSIRLHLDQGFLENQKLLLAPQIPRSTPNYERLRSIFKSQASIDQLLNSALFVVGILGDSAALQAASSFDAGYAQAALAELKALAQKLTDSGLTEQVKLLLIYVPLATKDDLVAEFDRRLKGLQ